MSTKVETEGVTSADAFLALLVSRFFSSNALIASSSVPTDHSLTWRHVQVLLTGAILCQGVRRVSTILRVMGLSQIRRFEKYHQVLNRAKWNSVTGSKILLGLLLQLLPSSYPLLIVVDDTIERRSGKKIKAKGCYRDACRSTEAVVR